MNTRFTLFAVFLLGMVSSAQALDTYGPVRRGEDLWDIAKHVYHDQDVSRDQVMLALLKANPLAFEYACNVNSPLKAGEKLQIPALAMVNALSRADALREFERQLREWEDHRLAGGKFVCPPASEAAKVAPAQTAPPAPTAVAPVESPTPAPEVAAPTAKPVVKPAIKPMESALEQRIVWDLDWVAIPILLLLLAGIAWWKYRFKPAAPSPVAAPPESAMDFTTETVDAVLAHLRTDRAKGLSAVEAADRVREVGPNALEEKHVTLLQRILPYFWG
ncbi:MAG: hypothetical protein KDJ70_04260, partial [Candidatus Competibacteraceae bacterium]|nr:hypothetical protein [Candidatus Competibacteraceae bacterium]